MRPTGAARKGFLATYILMKWIIVASLLLSGMSLMFIANMKFASILDLVNSRLPPNRQISPIGANTRTFEISHLYKTHYPDGNLHRITPPLGATGLMCIILAVVPGAVLAR
jgi:hypothetical protein